MSVWAIILAAGSGGRFGGPKQWFHLAGRPVIDWAIEAARPAVDGLVVVAPIPCRGADATVPGGHSRSQSVRCGLAAVPVDADVIVVHDAARPAATTALWARAVGTVRAGAFAAVPVVPVVDSLRDDEGCPVPRDGLWHVQTPQAFRAGVLREAHEDARESTDDASLIHPRRVTRIAGDPANVKLTVRDHIPLLEAILAERARMETHAWTA